MVPTRLAAAIYFFGRSPRLSCSLYVLIGYDGSPCEFAHAEPKADGKDGRPRRQNGVAWACIGSGRRFARGILASASGQTFRRPDPLAPIGSGGRLRLSESPQYILRVGCRRCARTVEIQKSDAIRLYGRDAVWKDVGQRLLGNTCQQRTGRHAE